ncbi:hypothetical protein QQP08_025109 [Theobroma cacao]|nr:hypothetical protein QQP08_025109 [Theobroma cacao]
MCIMTLEWKYVQKHILSNMPLHKRSRILVLFSALSLELLLKAIVSWLGKLFQCNFGFMITLGKTLYVKFDPAKLRKLRLSFKEDRASCYCWQCLKH